MEGVCVQNRDKAYEKINVLLVIISFSLSLHVDKELQKTAGM